jgi:hypothetical protein
MKQCDEDINLQEEKYERESIAFYPSSGVIASG